MKSKITYKGTQLSGNLFLSFVLPEKKHFVNELDKHIAIARILMIVLFLFGLESTGWASGGPDKEADLDPIAFRFYSDKSQVKIGEEFELTVVAVRRQNWDFRLGNTALDSDYRIKVVFPDGFQQTGGNYSDFVYEKLDNQKPKAEYKIRGKFTSQPASNNFMLLRGTKYSAELNRYLFRAEIQVTVIEDIKPNAVSQRLLADDCSSETIAGYGNTSENYTYSVSAGSAGTYTVKVSYSRWEASSTVNGSIKVNGGAAQPLSFAYTGGPDNYQDVTFSVALLAGNNNFQIFGGSNGYFRTKKVCIESAGCQTLPAAPVLSASPSTIAPGASSTLTATNCAGNVTWSVDAVPAATKTVSPPVTTTYTATCTVGGCTSVSSSVIVTVQQPSADICSSESVFGYGNSSESFSYTINGVSAGSYTVKLSYSRHEAASTATGSIKVNGGASQPLSLAYTGGPDNYQEVTFAASLQNGTNTFQIFGGPNGFFRTKRICIQGSVCTTPAAPTITKTSGTTVCATTSPAQSVTLTAAGCSGGTINWYKDAGAAPVGSGAALTTTDAGSYIAKCTVSSCASVASNAVVVAQSSTCTNSLTPKMSSRGLPEALTLSIVADPANAGSWLISDTGTISLPTGYEWSYFVGTKWIRRSTNLVNEPWQSNSPGRVVKMATKIGLDTLNRWPCPNDGCGGYYQNDAVAQSSVGITTFIFN